MELKTEGQVKMIVNSFRRVFESRDIGNLNNSAYKFIYLCSGFIAHYNLLGFRDAYQNIETLREALFTNEAMNQWRNFSPKDRDYAYMMQKRDIYNQIVSVAEETNQ
jgi:hypothetical protein